MKRYVKFDSILFCCLILAMCVLSVSICVMKYSYQTQLQDLKNQLDNQQQPSLIFVEIQREEPPIEEEQLSNLSLYEQLTPEEIELIELTIQHEVGNFSKEYRRLVAGVIRNRLESSIFPNTISEVLLAKGQFTDGNYEGVIVDEQTKEAVKEVFSAEQSIHSATYYYNPTYSAASSIKWFEESGDVSYLFSYAEDSWGTTYTTRFFK